MTRKAKILLMVVLILVGTSIIGPRPGYFWAKAIGIGLVVAGALVGTLADSMTYSRYGSLVLLGYYAIMGIALMAMKAGFWVVLTGILLLAAGVVVAVFYNRCTHCGAQLLFMGRYASRLTHCPYCGAGIKQAWEI